MTKGTRPVWKRYGLAILLFAVILAISLTLASFSIRVSLSITWVIAIVAATIYGGRGPGLLLAVLLLARMVQLNGFPGETSVGQSLFGFISSFSLLVFLVFLISVLKTKAVELREHRELLRVTLSSIGDAVITTNVEGAINFLNPTAQSLTGWKADTALGKPLSEVFSIIDEETRVHVSDPLRIVDGEFTLSGPVSRTVLAPRDGEELPIEHRAAQIKDKDGDVIGAVIVFRDISLRRAAEEALLESEHRLQQSQKMEAIGTLTGGVAHDFNNLLTAILGYTQLAIARLESGMPVKPLLTEVENAGNRAAELTRQLLAFSRRQRLDQRNISITETVGEIVKLLERIIEADVKIIVKHAPDVKPVFADPAQIEQVIMNLSVNARDAMPAGGRLIIETNNVELDEYYCSQYPDVEPGKYVQIRVTDSGVGMDAKTQSRIFEPFFTTKAQNKGTGLGLSMAYGIVKQHGGHISVYSEPGEGTAINVFLPAAEEEAVEERRRVVENVTEGGHETVLIAEDEEMLRNLSRDLLESLGYRVLVTKNGEEAVQVFEADGEDIDVLLFDVVMPAMGGLEAYEKIRRLVKGEIPVVFMTGYSPEFVQDKFIRNEQLADMPKAKVIQKPYTLDGLGRSVREALGKKDLAEDPREPV